MKNYKLLLGLAAGLFFAGCSTDDLGNDSPIVEKDEIRYMNVSICASGTEGADTRANFEQGTENNIRSLKFFFYDNEGRPLANNTGTPVNTTDGENEVEKVMSSVVEVRLTKGSKLPAYVVCLINATGDLSPYESETMDGLRLKTTSKISEDQTVDDETKTYFMMNNSVYYGYDKISGKNSVRLFGSPIDPATQLYTSATAAQAAGAKKIEIYVERFAAKVTVKKGYTATEIKNTDVDGYELVFTPKAWAVNADAANTYLAKCFYQEGQSSIVPDSATVAGNLRGWTWNERTYHRSYWACSPSYYANDFPTVSDDIKDQKSTGTGAGEMVGNYKLKYYSWNQIVANGKAFSDAAVPLYTMENTASVNAFNSDNPKAAVPSVVLCGQYKVNAASGSTNASLKEGTTFYLYGKTTDEKWKLFSTEGTLKQDMISKQALLASNATGATVDASKLKIIHPTLATRKAAVTGTNTTVKVPTRYVTLQVDPEALSDIYIRNSNKTNASDPDWVQITVNDVNDINVRLIQQLGYAQMYDGGACYYSVPIKHLRFGVGESAGQDAPNKDLQPNHPDFDWKQVRPGDFGLVRNHSYQINITSITGLATGMSDKDMPIVPPMDEDEYWIGYEINILKWAVVPPQDVNL